MATTPRSIFSDVVLAEKVNEIEMAIEMKIIA
jgi:hypothetical protein